jgi:AcrR family transcriptional regulator
MRRAQLLTVALEVFVEQGYHAASMDEIADRAGVSKPVLYQHFPGKLELYVALLESSVDTVLDGVKQALASTTDNRRRVEATMRHWYDSVANPHNGAFRLVFESDLTNDDRVNALVERVVNESASAIAEVIHEDTGLPYPASQLLAASLVGIGVVGGRNWMSSDSAITRDEAIALASGLAWRGISGYPIHSEGEE